MDQYTGAGSWGMIPPMPTHSNSPAHSNPDHMLFSPQHHQQQQQQPQFYQQTQFTQQQFQPQQQHVHQLQQQQRSFQNQNQNQQQQIIQQQQNQNQHHQSLASHFHLLHLVENLADAIENGTRDQQSDALVTELNSHFEKCQQLLNSISGSISSKSMTVEGQKRKLEETEQLLSQRRELIANYRNSVEELIKPEL